MSAWAGVARQVVDLLWQTDGNVSWKMPFQDYETSETGSTNGLLNDPYRVNKPLLYSY